MWRYLRLHAFDTDTETGRAAERYRRAAWGAAGNVAARVMSMLAMVLAIHLFAPVLGPERFGVWAIFAGLAATLSFLDLGIGNALVNKVAQAEAAANRTLLGSTVAAGIGWLAVAGVLSSAALAALAMMIPWGSLLKLSGPALSAEARSTALVFALIFGVHMLSSGALKVLNGQQRSHEAHAASAIGTVLTIAALWLNSDRQMTVPELLSITFGVQTLGGLAVIGLLWHRGLLRFGRMRAGMRVHAKTLARTGSLFLLLQVGTMIGWGLDAVLLGATAGASAVAALAVTQRLFQFASQPVAVVNAPLWAAYADAMAAGDKAFIRKTLFRAMIASVALGATLAILLLTTGSWLIERWTQSSIDVAYSLLLVAALWVTIECGGVALATYLNGTGVLREQVVVVVAFCVVALPLKIWASTHFGATGLISATIAAYVLVPVGCYATIFRKRILAPIMHTAARPPPL
jgi:O-antigen/teichoic acid export membrane protein